MVTHSHCFSLLSLHLLINLMPEFSDLVSTCLSYFSVLFNNEEYKVNFVEVVTHSMVVLSLGELYLLIS